MDCWDWSTQYGCWRDRWCGRHGDYHPCTKPIIDDGLSLCAEHAAELGAPAGRPDGGS
ncbi:MAG TPA: hypothetical protein VG476_05410 [Acidimicrobiales bacterium]|nr:hypothetical protein [Acidimicrobiales bacterium]